jgi:hypothetical protein
MSSPAGRVLGVSTAMALAMWLAACDRGERVIGLGENIRHDDFEYSVRHVESTPRIGDRRAAGRFHVVTFQVENRSERTDHIWTSHIAYVVDDRGRVFENDAAGEMAYVHAQGHIQKLRRVTPAGAIERATLVFDLPADVREAFLKVRGDLFMGDVLDGNQFKRTRVRIF